MDIHGWVFSGHFVTDERAACHSHGLCTRCFQTRCSCCSSESSRANLLGLLTPLRRGHRLRSHRHNAASKLRKLFEQQREKDKKTKIALATRKTLRGSSSTCSPRRLEYRARQNETQINNRKHQDVSLSTWLCGSVFVWLQMLFNTSVVQSSSTHVLVLFFVAWLSADTLINFCTSSLVGFWLPGEGLDSCNDSESSH